MKQTCIVLMGLVMAVGAAGAEPAGAWSELFNGSDLSGWVKRGGEATYRVEDGAVVGTSAPNTSNTFLCTEATYGDFVLEFEFKSHPELNSGVQVRGQSRPDYRDGRVHGYQVELEEEGRDRHWSGGIYDEARRGWMYPAKDDTNAGTAFSEQGKAIWKQGEWNQVRVEARGPHIRTWVNGELRADLHDDMDAEGFIALQVHGVGSNATPMSVAWRNIRLKPIGDDARTGGTTE